MTSKSNSSVSPQPSDIERLIRIKEVIHLTGMSRAAIYQKAATGLFPSPLKLSERSSAWRLSLIQEWIAQRIAESRSSDDAA